MVGIKTGANKNFLWRAFVMSDGTIFPVNIPPPLEHIILLHK